MASDEKVLERLIKRDGPQPDGRYPVVPPVVAGLCAAIIGPLGVAVYQVVRNDLAFAEMLLSVESLVMAVALGIWMAWWQQQRNERVRKIWDAHRRRRDPWGRGTDR